MKRSILVLAFAVAAAGPASAAPIQINGAGATFPFPNELGYAPLPASVVKLEMAALARIK
jgi:hypothetical protein